jgi:hypothetical protein
VPGGGRGAPLEPQGGHRHLPPVVLAPDHVLLRAAGVGEEDLVEVGTSVDLLDGPHLDPGLLHGHQQVGDARVLGGIGVGAGQQEDVVGELGLGGPHLLAVDHPLVAVEFGPGLERGQVAAGVGLGEPLAPGDGPVEDAGDELLLLLLGGPLQDGGADQGVAEEVGPQGGLGPGELLVQHHRLHQRESLAPVLHWPRGADPAPGEQLGGPLLVEGLPLLAGHGEPRARPTRRAGCRSATGGSRRGRARSRRGSSGPWADIIPPAAGGGGWAGAGGSPASRGITHRRPCPGRSCGGLRRVHSRAGTATPVRGRPPRPLREVWPMRRGEPPSRTGALPPVCAA